MEPVSLRGMGVATRFFELLVVLLMQQVGLLILHLILVGFLHALLRENVHVNLLRQHILLVNLDNGLGGVGLPLTLLLLTFGVSGLYFSDLLASTVNLVGANHECTTTSAAQDQQHQENQNRDKADLGRI